MKYLLRVLKSLEKHVRMVSSMSGKQVFDYFVILDFEATCQANNQPSLNEIIEFPALLVDTHSLQIKSQFHSFVRPLIEPELSSFCYHLTGITQEIVDESPSFPFVFESFQKWLQERQGSQLAFMTCGNWDLNCCLVDECKRNNITLTEQFKHWIDIKQSFFQVNGVWPKGLQDMMAKESPTMVGRPHSGRDDCMNLYLLLCKLVSKGHVFNITNHCHRKE